MADAPQLDGRRAREIRRELRDLAPYYVPEWDPEAGGVGAGLVDVFAEMAAEVTERLDAVPAKHRLAFFDALGFDARPPQAARVPVQYTVAPDAPRNVAVRPGTQAVAEAGEEVTFRVGAADAFEATPARLTDVLAVEPADDEIFDHGAAIDGNGGNGGDSGNGGNGGNGDDQKAGGASGEGDSGSGTGGRASGEGGGVTLFTGDDEQAHEWFVGDAKLLAAGATDTITLDLATDADGAVLRDSLEWHYYGTGETAAGEGWQRFDSVELSADPAGDVALDLSPAGEVVEFAVDGVESRWIRSRLDPGDQPTGELHFAVTSVDLQTGSAGSQVPDRLLANDVPQPTDPGDEESILPFGDQPRPGDAFYLAAGTALTKAGARVTLAFTPTSADGVRTDGGLIAEEAGRILREAERQGLDVDVEEDLRDAIAEATGPGGWDPPTVSWEYWDGDGWSRIPGLGDGTEGFTVGADPPIQITFPVPDDLEATSVAGHEEHWIRVRLVGGGYGQVVHVPQNEDETRWVRQERGPPPEFDAIDVTYDATALCAPAQIRTRNALAWHRHGADDRLVPFRALPEDEQTLYLGFDAPLSGGPLQLFWAVDEHPYPAAFEPRVRWERRTADGDGWARLTVQDDTAGLTEQGILGLAVPGETGESAQFGRERHWIRARVTGDRFDTPTARGESDDADGGVGPSRLPGRPGRLPDLPARRGGRRLDAGPNRLLARVGRSAGGGTGSAGDRQSDAGHAGLAPCGETVATEPPGGEQSEEPPDVTGVYANAGWARNVRRVEDEVLGDSDGERDQTFDVANPPAIDAAVWVDESTALSGPQRETLESERPEAVETERTESGDVRAVWVRWETVPDLVDSGPDDRHAVVDATAGTVRFGDGTRGQVPPRGTNNVRVSYETGGGAAGNVPAGAVSEFASGLPFVEEVANPVGGVAGADAESSDDIAGRAMQTLKDRGRAVMPADYERIAADASRRIARTRAIPAMDAGGGHAPGRVTVLVVPRESGETPVPSVGLLDRVEDELGERAPASVVDRDRLVVRGPSYVAVGVRADVVAGDVASLGAVETRVRETVADFLHPLDGRDGDGWAFGALPTRSDLFARLEGVEGVDHLASLVLTVTGKQTVTVGEGEAQPTVAPDTLVRNGDHDVTVSLGGDR